LRIFELLSVQRLLVSDIKEQRVEGFEVGEGLEFIVEIIAEALVWA